MNDEQVGPPTEAEREQRDIDFLKRAQDRYAEGYRMRAATAPPDLVVGSTRGGRQKKKAQPYASIADRAEGLCPPTYPKHERERWIAGFTDADRFAVQRGHYALEGRDPLLPPPKPKSPPVAEPLDAFGDEGRMPKQEARDFWRRHRGQSFVSAFQDAGEQ